MQRHTISSEGAPKKSSKKLGRFSLRRSSAGDDDKEIELLDIGDEAPDFELCDEDGNMHRLSSYRGRRVILSFFRFDRLKQQAAFLKKADIATLCVFRSAPAMLAAASNATSHLTDGGHALSDKKGAVYQQFQVKGGKMKTIVFAAADFISNVSKYKQYMDVGKTTGEKTGFTENTQLPADFLIDENGIIVDLLRATKPQEHMTFERIEAFVPKEKRCNCHKKDCISPTCRRIYEEIRKDSEAMLFMG